MIDRLARDSLIAMTGGFIVWSVYFVSAYAFLSIGCVATLDTVRVLGMNAVLFALALMTVAAFAAIAYFGWRSLQAARAETPGAAEAGPPRRGFMAMTAGRGAGLALIATVWVAAPMLFLAPCA